MRLKFFVILTMMLSITNSNAAIELSGTDYISNELKQFNQREKILVAVFLSAACPCSHSHVKYLSQLAREFDDFTFVGIHSNQDQSFDEGLKYFKDNHMSFPVLRDDKAKMADTLGALKTPHVFVIDKNDKILFQGPVTDASHFPNAMKFYLKDFLVSLKTGRDFEAIKKRPLGCYIVR